MAFWGDVKEPLLTPAHRKGDVPPPSLHPSLHVVTNNSGHRHCQHRSHRPQELNLDAELRRHLQSGVFVTEIGSKRSCLFLCVALPFRIDDGLKKPSRKKP